MMLFFPATYMMNIAGPFYFQGVVSFQPTQVGLVFLLVPVVMVVASPVTGLLAAVALLFNRPTTGTSETN